MGINKRTKHLKTNDLSRMLLLTNNSNDQKLIDNIAIMISLRITTLRWCIAIVDLNNYYYTNICSSTRFYNLVEMEMNEVNVCLTV